MLHYQFIVASALIAVLPLSAQAQMPTTTTSATIAPGAFLRTADGKRAGQIFSVDKTADGKVTGAALIGSGSVLVHVPISTITAVDKSHFTTSMTYKEVFR